MKGYISFIIWIISTVLMISLFTTLLTMSSTLMNIIGFIIAALWAYISYTTQAFTNLKKQNNEKSN